MANHQSYEDKVRQQQAQKEFSDIVRRNNSSSLASMEWNPDEWDDDDTETKVEVKSKEQRPIETSRHVNTQKSNKAHEHRESTTPTKVKGIRKEKPSAKEINNKSKSPPKLTKVKSSTSGLSDDAEWSFFIEAINDPEYRVRSKDRAIYLTDDVVNIFTLCFGKKTSIIVNILARSFIDRHREKLRNLLLDKSSLL